MKVQNLLLAGAFALLCQLSITSNNVYASAAENDSQYEQDKDMAEENNLDQQQDSADEQQEEAEPVDNENPPETEK